MADTAPRIFAYLDFRQYLQDCYRFRKARSPGWFKELLQGRGRLSERRRLRLAKTLGLNPRESRYLQAMTAYGNSSSMQTKDYWLGKMLAFRESRLEVVGGERLQFYRKWYYSAVRELLFSQPFRGDYGALARQLNPAITRAEAKESIHLLARLGFIVADRHGRYRPRGMTLKKDPALPSPAVRQFLKTHLKLAMRALDRHPKEARDISALTVSLSESAFRQLSQDIRLLRRKVLESTDRTAPGKVYQCNFQIFPLSK